MSECVCVCVCACARVCVCVYVCEREPWGLTQELQGYSVSEASPKFRKPFCSVFFRADTAPLRPQNSQHTARLRLQGQPQREATLPAWPLPSRNPNANSERKISFPPAGISESPSTCHETQTCPVLGTSDPQSLALHSTGRWPNPTHSTKGGNRAGVLGWEGLLLLRNMK